MQKTKYLIALSMLFCGCAQDKVLNLQKPLNKSQEVSKKLQHKRLPMFNAILLEKSSDTKLAETAKTQTLETQKEYAQKIQEYINYYNSQELIRPSKSVESKVSNLYFYIEDHNIVKPKENIEIIKDFKKKNKIPMPDETAEYFQIYLRKHNNQQSVENKPSQTKKVYNYDYINKITNKGINSFYNIY